jgi:hypothetical protein
MNELKLDFTKTIVWYFKSENHLIPECQLYYGNLGNVNNSEDCEWGGGGSFMQGHLLFG